MSYHEKREEEWGTGRGQSCHHAQPLQCDDRPGQESNSYDQAEVDNSCQDRHPKRNPLIGMFNRDEEQHEVDEVEEHPDPVDPHRLIHLPLVVHKAEEEVARVTKQWSY